MARACRKSIGIARAAGWEPQTDAGLFARRRRHSAGRSRITSTDLLTHQGRNSFPLCIHKPHPETSGMSMASPHRVFVCVPDLRKIQCASGFAVSVCQNWWCMLAGPAAGSQGSLLRQAAVCMQKQHHYHQPPHPPASEVPFLSHPQSLCIPKVGPLYNEDIVGRSSCCDFSGCVSQLAACATDFSRKRLSGLGAARTRT